MHDKREIVRGLADGLFRLQLGAGRCPAAGVLLGEGFLVVTIRPQARGLPIGRPALGDGLFHERRERTAVKNRVEDSSSNSLVMALSFP